MEAECFRISHLILFLLSVMGDAILLHSSLRRLFLTEDLNRMYNDFQFETFVVFDLSMRNDEK